MTIDQWLSLQLPAAHHTPYQQGAFSTVESADRQVLAILRRSQMRPGQACVRLATAASAEEARAVATVLRVMNPI